MNATCVLENKDPAAVAGIGRPYCLYPRASVRFRDFGSRKESDFPEWMQSHTRYGDAAKSNARSNTRSQYGNLAHVGDGHLFIYFIYLFIWNLETKYNAKAM